ncbi:MAG TPA: hypothetical protein PKA64_03690 [Myxococcota bacterium]|nr:hypothetical protein [Myxococcota bacterium]
MKVKKAKNGRFYKQTSEGVRLISDVEARKLKRNTRKGTKRKSTKRRR